MVNTFEVPGLGEFSVIPSGVGVLGNEGLVRGWDGELYDEYPTNGPRRCVQFESTVAMLSTPVTVAMFNELLAGRRVADEPVYTLPACQSIDAIWQLRAFSEVNARADLPVVGVTWDDAVAFCEAASARLGRRIRLPTEREWEIAARAGSSSVYFWGDDVRASVDYAWSDRNSGMNVQPVARLLPNRWGLYDMAGNVWEWCIDLFDPTDSQGLRRAIRGGSACHHATATRCAHRFGMNPSQRNAFLGFRCVIELSGDIHERAGR
jgi:formylglycine-generating enzyme required for sulfatase activity